MTGQQIVVSQVPQGPIFAGMTSSHLSKPSTGSIYLSSMGSTPIATAATTVSLPVIRDNENQVLASLPPIDRWKYLARHNKAELIVSIISLFGGIYMLVAAGIHLEPVLGKWFSFAAFAQSNAPATNGYSSRELFEWYVGLLMGVSLLLSWCLTMFATAEGKVSFGKDTTRTIIGFVVGFLSGAGGKVR